MNSFVIKCFLLFVMVISLYANDFIFSNIPVAKNEVININPDSCNKSCLKELSQEDMIFSFIARFDPSIDNEELNSIMESYASEIGIYYKIKFDSLDNFVEVALLIPKKLVGKYSTTTIDTILAYLLSRDIDFRFKIFDSTDENYDNLSNMVDKIKEEHFNFVIALISSKDNITSLENLDIPVYIPTITGYSNKKNIIFGGIDYHAQLNILNNEKDSSSNTIVYNDDSIIGRNLGIIIKNINDGDNIIEDVITNRTAANFSFTLSKHQNFLQKSNIFLNTPVVKTGLILSQINNSKNKPNKIFSTQVNYNPALLSLVKDLELSDSIVIANSIGNIDQRLVEYGKLLSSDLTYDWVNYSTALGIDLFINKMAPHIKRYFSEEVIDNSVYYGIKMYKIEDGIFVDY